jgi:hypothetical protein
VARADISGPLGFVVVSTWLFPRQDQQEHSFKTKSEIRVLGAFLMTPPSTEHAVQSPLKRRRPARSCQECRRKFAELRACLVHIQLTVCVQDERSSVTLHSHAVIVECLGARACTMSARCRPSQAQLPTPRDHSRWKEVQVLLIPPELSHLRPQCQ